MFRLPIVKSFPVGPIGSTPPELIEQSTHATKRKRLIINSGEIPLLKTLRLIRILKCTFLS